MEIVGTKNQDAINGAVFVIIKYLIEQSLDMALSHLPSDDPAKPLLTQAVNGRVDNDVIQQILMGYCVSEKGALGQHMLEGLKIIKHETDVIVQTLGG